MVIAFLKTHRHAAGWEVLTSGETSGAKKNRLLGAKSGQGKGEKSSSVFHCLQGGGTQSRVGFKGNTREAKVTMVGSRGAAVGYMAGMG